MVKQDLHTKWNEGEYIKTWKHKPIGKIMILRMLINHVVVTKGLKVATLSDVLHILMEILEYAMPPCPNAKSYYAILNRL
jgi:hypothetical protein